MDTPRHHSASSILLDKYPVRILLGLVASLGLMIVLVNLPLHSPESRVGWSGHTPAEQIVLDEVSTEQSEELTSKGTEQAPPPTDLRAFPSARQSSSDSSESSGKTTTRRDSGWARRYEDIGAITELNVTDQTPHIVGGAASLYLHINYPEKALAQGIEGTLELEFTVKTDGSVAGMEVVESLHPLCDSAAVEGVRSVTFVPAKHNGTPIPIRLRLPVRFQLTTVSTSLPANRTNP